MALSFYLALQFLKAQNKVEKIHERSLKFLNKLSLFRTVRNSREKTSFIPAVNLEKLFDTTWKFQGQKPRPMEIPHGFFLNTLALEIPLLFLMDPWNFHMLFLQYPWKFHVLNPQLLWLVWIFSGIAHLVLESGTVRFSQPTHRSHFIY